MMRSAAGRRAFVAITLGVSSLVLLLMSGCFPIELDVSNGAILIARGEGVFVFDIKTGTATRVAAASDKIEPVSARFSPDGKEALVIAKVPGEGFDDTFSFTVTPSTGGAAKEIFRTPLAMYAAYSPDGSQVAVLRAAKDEDPTLKQRMPELVLVPAAGGTPRTLAHNVGPVIRWLADSKRILIFEISKKGEHDSYTGNLSTIDVASGKISPLLSVAASSDAFMDVSHDGSRALFTAVSAVKAGATLPPVGENSSMHLFELNLASGAVQKFDLQASYAIFSPDDKKVLLTLPPSGFSIDTASLQIADADLKNLIPLVDNAYKPLSFGGDEVYFPGWIDQNTVFFFQRQPVYGTVAKNVSLWTIGTDGKNKHSLQPEIDSGVAKASQ